MADGGSLGNVGNSGEFHYGQCGARCCSAIYGGWASRYQATRANRASVSAGSKATSGASNARRVGRGNDSNSSAGNDLPGANGSCICRQALRIANRPYFFRNERLPAYGRSPFVTVAWRQRPRNSITGKPVLAEGQIHQRWKSKAPSRRGAVGDSIRNIDGLQMAAPTSPVMRLLGWNVAMRWITGEVGKSKAPSRRGAMGDSIRNIDDFANGRADLPRDAIAWMERSDAMDHGGGGAPFQGWGAMVAALPRAALRSALGFHGTAPSGRN